MSEDIDSLNKRVDKLYFGLHMLMMDYHNRFHKDTANTGGYKACIEWPCLQFAIKVWD